MERQLPKKKWLERIGIAAYLCAVWAVIIWAIVALTSCATKKELYELHAHHIQADTLAAEAKTDAQMKIVKNYADSLFTSLRQEYSASWLRHEDNQETITETITTATDSLGRQLRTEQRTTTRTLQREEQQRIEQVLTDLRRELSTRLAAYDGEWRQNLAALQTHWEDSLASMRQQLQQTGSDKPAPWYCRLWGRLLLFLAGAITGCILWAKRKSLFK